MAEAEEVISDVARHATVYARTLWHRYRTSPDQPTTVTLNDVAARLDLLITAVFGEGYPMRVAQPPAYATMLAILFRHDRQASGTDTGYRWRVAVAAPGSGAIRCG